MNRSPVHPGERSRTTRILILSVAILLALGLTVMALALPAWAAPARGTAQQSPGPDPERAPPSTEEDAPEEIKPADEVQGVAIPAIDLTKTVGLDPNACATTDSILVDRGTQVYYCYSLENTGNVTLTLHDLVDDQLGSLLSGFNFSLTPGASVFLTSTAFLTEAVRNEATWTAYNPGPTDVTADTNAAQVYVGAERGTLVAGTGDFGGAFSDPVFEISVEVTNSAVALFSGFAVGGATYDQAGGRVLFTSSNDSGSGAEDFADLWSWPISGGFPTPIGVISTTSGTLRVDGLAIADGLLYGVHQFDSPEGLPGLYQIDWVTLQATLVITTPDGGISGIDADPQTGIIYGVNDNSGHLVEIDFTTGITDVVAYPAGENDIDGLAIDDAHRAYLITDDPSSGEVFVFNLETGSYETSLASPWMNTETFSGGAFIYGPAEVYLPLVTKAP
jgi:hypothetical protein